MCKPEASQRSKNFGWSKNILRSPMLLSLQTKGARGTGKSSNFTVSFLDQNEPAWHCPLLTLRTADTVVNCHLNHTHIIISPSANTNKVLALLKISWVFICNRDFYWELSRKSQHLYSFDLSTLPVQLRSLEHTSSIALWSQLACFSTSVLYLGRSLLGSSWHCHFA